MAQILQEKDEDEEEGLHEGNQPSVGKDELALAMHDDEVIITNDKPKPILFCC